MNTDWATPRVLRGTALASVVANVGIVITGGAVRLTGSGLGCPTWPTCTADSFVPTAALGIHGVIEFSNRTLTGVLGVIAVAGLVLALLQRPRRGRVVRLATLALLGIPAQAILGKITVVTNLNPWVVGCHFLLTTAVIAATYAFWRSTRDSDAPPVPVVAQPLRVLAAGVLAVTAAVLAVGTVVTGSGPHAGDEHAVRNGLDPASVAQVHADLVFLVVGLSVAAWLAFRAAGARLPAVRAGWLVAVLAAQGLIGFVQYATGLPEILVGAHLLGACLVWLAALSLWYATRVRAAVDPSPAGADSVAAAAEDGHGRAVILERTHP